MRSFIMQVGKNTKHSFSDIQKAAEKMKNLHRQVLHAEDKKNHFIDQFILLKNRTMVNKKYKRLFLILG